MAWNDRSLKVLGILRYYLLTERAEQSVRDCSQLFLFNLRNEIHWTSDWHLTSHWYLFSGSNIYFGENYKMQDFLALWWVNFRPKSKVIMGYHVFFGSSYAHCPHCILWFNFNFFRVRYIKYLSQLLTNYYLPRQQFFIPQSSFLFFLLFTAPFYLLFSIQHLKRFLSTQLNLSFWLQIPERLKYKTTWYL